MADHPYMREAMIADLISIGEDLLDQLLLTRGRGSDQKEGRVHPIASQCGECPGRSVSGRPIIQRQRDQRLIGIDMADRFADQ